MPTTREILMQEASGLFRHLELHVEAEGILQHLNIAIEMENTFTHILNFLYGWNLENANFGKKNQDSFDLADETARIAVQVTKTIKPKKIHKTLKTFIGTHDKNYDRLIFVYPKLTVNKTTADFTHRLNGFKFDADEDRFSLGTLLTKAQTLPAARQQLFLDLLRQELGPLLIIL